MKDEAVSKKVIWDMIVGWMEEDEYYSGKKPKTIPLSEVKALLEECPVVGVDMAYIKSERLENAKKNGQWEIIKSVAAALRPYMNEGELK